MNHADTEYGQATQMDTRKTLATVLKKSIPRIFSQFLVSVHGNEGMAQTNCIASNTPNVTRTSKMAERTPSPYDNALDTAREECCRPWPKACTYHEGYGDGYAQAEQDSAAPDLLEVLEKMRYQSRAAWMTMGSALRARCEAAIAKAKGERSNMKVQWVRVGRSNCHRCGQRLILYTADFRTDVLCGKCCKVIDSGCLQQCYPPDVHHADCTMKIDRKEV